MVIEDKIFGGELTEITLGRRQVNFTEMFIGRHFY